MISIENNEQRRPTMTFGEKLKSLRTSKGISAKQLGKLVGVSDKSISNYETGKQIPRDKICEALAKELSVPIKELTELIPNPESPVEKKAKAPVEKKAPAKKEKKSKAEKTEPVEIPAEPIEESAPTENSTEPTEEIMNAPIEAATEAPVENSTPTEPVEPDADKVLTLAQKLKALRQEKKLTNAMIAKEVGISVETYKSFEYRNRRPRDIKIYDKLAKVLGCDVSYLMEGDKRFEKQTAEKKAQKSKKAEQKSKHPAEKPKHPAKNVTVIPGKKATAFPEELVQATVSDKSSDVIKLVSELSVLLSGDEISQKEKDSIMLSLNGAYWKSR